MLCIRNLQSTKNMQNPGEASSENRRNHAAFRRCCFYLLLKALDGNFGLCAKTAENHFGFIENGRKHVKLYKFSGLCLTFISLLKTLDEKFGIYKKPAEIRRSIIENVRDHIELRSF